MNFVDIILLIVIFTAVVRAILKIIQNKKQGIIGCCGDCSKCNGCSYGEK